LDVSGTNGEPVLFEIYDAMGRKVFSKNINTEKTTHGKYELIPDEKLSGGNYLLIATGQWGKITKMIMVE